MVRRTAGLLPGSGSTGDLTKRGGPSEEDDTADVGVGSGDVGHPLRERAVVGAERDVEVVGLERPTGSTMAGEAEGAGVGKQEARSTSRAAAEQPLAVAHSSPPPCTLIASLTARSSTASGPSRALEGDTEATTPSPRRSHLQGFTTHAPDQEEGGGSPCTGPITGKPAQSAGDRRSACDEYHEKALTFRNVPQNRFDLEYIVPEDWGERTFLSTKHSTQSITRRFRSQRIGFTSTSAVDWRSNRELIEKRRE